MIFYLRNLFTNPIMFGIMLESYLSPKSWHKFHEDIIMHTCTVCKLENVKFQWKNHTCITL